MREGYSKAKPEAPGYLARYLERATESGSGPGGASGTPEESFYLRRLRASTSGSVDYRGSWGREVIEAHLIRHGQTQGYTVDGGLTPLGALQARERGWRISKEIIDGENVALVAAETKRALRTAKLILGGVEDGTAALEKRVSITGPELVDELQNFLVRTPSGFKDPTVAARERQVEVERAGRNGSSIPLWLEEVGRFWGRQQAGADPIEYWLTFPLVFFEPPASVVRRYWEGLIGLARENESLDRLICAVHSGPMRAFATTALGRDLGEPDNAEEVRVSLRRDLSEAEVSYRGHSRKVEVPHLEGYKGWAALTQAKELEEGTFMENGFRAGSRTTITDEPTELSRKRTEKE